MNFVFVVRQVVKWLLSMRDYVPVGLVVAAIRSLVPLPKTDAEVDRWLDRAWSGIKPLLSYYVKKVLPDMPAVGAEFSAVEREAEEAVSELQP